jgi:hypothetical protein
LAPHTLLQLCDSENAETLQIYYSVREPVVVFLHKRAVFGRIVRSRATRVGGAARFERFLATRTLSEWNLMSRWPPFNSQVVS